MQDFYNMELAAIWLNKPLRVPGHGEIRRLASGHFVRIINDQLIDDVVPSHMVLQCRGGVSSNFRIIVQELNTGEITTVKL